MTVTRAVQLSPETEVSQRAAVVAEAKKWIRTPYHGGADILGAGCDCGMLLVRVFVDSGMVAPFDPRPYAQDWMMHNTGEKYLGFVDNLCGQVATPSLGDVALFRYGNCFSHGGIITGLDPVRIVHAYFFRNAVVEEDLYLNEDLVRPGRKMTFFSLWAENQKAGA
jgi:cell wall-associated NlpC family hydrolase